MIMDLMRIVSLKQCVQKIYAPMDPQETPKIVVAHLIAMKKSLQKSVENTLFGIGMHAHALVKSSARCYVKKARDMIQYQDVDA